MISSYYFSLTGRDHKNAGLPCHDYSAIGEISSSWKIAVVADGVGSCKHAEIASKIAVETVIELITRQFPPYSDDKEIYKSIIISAMHGAANAIEAYVEANDPDNGMEYQTTLTLAVMSRQCLFYGNAGDSGVIVLDEQGKYHVVTKKQKDAAGGVYSIPLYRNFEVGMVDFIPVAVVCSTDGVFDYLVPKELGNQECKVYVPFANLFVTYGLGVDDMIIEGETEKCKARMIEYLSSDICNMMKDDLSVSVLVSTTSYLQPEDIEWEAPDIDYYSILWQEASIYPSEQTRISYFVDAVKDNNPSLSNEQINELVIKYSGEKVNCDEKISIDNFKEPIEKAVDDIVATENNSYGEKTENESIMNDCRGFRLNLFGRKK